MIQSFIHTSENDNYYLYDDQRRLSILVHPEFEKAYEKHTEVDPYYLRKYMYLKEHGFFENPKITNFKILEESVVWDNIMNAKQIVFEVTEKCNLNCKYCGLSEQLYQTYDVRKNRDLPFKKAQLIIDHLLNLWRDNPVSDTSLRFAVSFYGGEPLINFPLIKKIIDYVEQSDVIGRKIHYSMTTNAMLLHKHIDFLAKKNFNLLVSLDGDEQSQSYRVDYSGKNSFNQVFSNVKLLQQEYPDYFNESYNFVFLL